MGMADLFFQLEVLGYMVYASVEDVRRKRLDIRVLIVFLIVSLVIIFIFGEGILNVNRLMGLIPGAILVVISKLSSEAIGMGDALVVLWLGYMGGIRMCMNTLMIAWACCFLTALIMFGVHRKKTIPFLPFLCAGYYLCLHMIYAG